jgi:hypothetical protein
MQAMIAYIDVPLSPEAPWPLAMERHLVFSSPMGKASKGSQYRDSEGEYFLKAHLVIVPKEEVTADESVVHVTARLRCFKATAQFAVATSGSPDRSDLELATTDE